MDQRDPPLNVFFFSLPQFSRISRWIRTSSFSEFLSILPWRRKLSDLIFFKGLGHLAAAVNVRAALVRQIWTRGNVVRRKQSGRQGRVAEDGGTEDKSRRMSAKNGSQDDATSSSCLAKVDGRLCWNSLGSCCSLVIAVGVWFWKRKQRQKILEEEERRVKGTAIKNEDMLQKEHKRTTGEHSHHLAEESVVQYLLDLKDIGVFLHWFTLHQFFLYICV
jgi:hypothetical protein